MQKTEAAMSWRREEQRRGACGRRSSTGERGSKSAEAVGWGQRQGQQQAGLRCRGPRSFSQSPHCPGRANCILPELFPSGPCHPTDGARCPGTAPLSEVDFVDQRPAGCQAPPLAASCFISPLSPTTRFVPPILQRENSLSGAGRWPAEATEAGNDRPKAWTQSI